MKTKKIRCCVCRRKIVMSYIECRCGGVYCGKHIDAKSHRCTYNYKKLGEKQIRERNPIVVKDKFERI